MQLVELCISYNIMEANIIQNSKGVMLPETESRQGWAEAAQRAHEAGDDTLLLPDVFEDETLEDWIW